MENNQLHLNAPKDECGHKHVPSCRDFFGKANDNKIDNNQDCLAVNLLKDVLVNSTCSKRV